MKRYRKALLIGIYIFALVITLTLEQVSIMIPTMRLIVNVSTLLLAVFGGGLSWLIYRGENDSQVKAKSEETFEAGENEAGEVAKQEVEAYVFDKEKYLRYANQYGLTRRETEIGLLVANGYSNQQIAEMLYIAETTVKKHLSHIYEKANVGGRKEWKDILQHLE